MRWAGRIVVGSVALATAGILATGAPADATPVVLEDVACTARAPDVNLEIETTADFTLEALAPATVPAGSPVSVSIPAGTSTLPAIASGVEITHLADIVLTYGVVGGTIDPSSVTTVSQPTIDGVPTGALVEVDAGALRVGVPGPVSPGTLVAPAVTFDVVGATTGPIVGVTARHSTLTAVIESLPIGDLIHTCELADTTLATTQVLQELAQPDIFIRRRSDGATTGDNLYNLDGAGQRRSRRIPAGSKWTYALRVGNDGTETDDLVVTAPSTAGAVSVRYFVGYYDVTALVSNGGFTFADVSPGEVRPLAMQFKASPQAIAGAAATVLVTVTCGADASATDAVQLGVVVQAP